jgi:hypothetical protein
MARELYMKRVVHRQNFPKTLRALIGQLALACSAATHVGSKLFAKACLLLQHIERLLDVLICR